MSLRRRFALAALLACVPASALLVVLALEVRHRSQVRSLADFARAIMQAGGRLACESDPGRFPRVAAAGGLAAPSNGGFPTIEFPPGASLRAEAGAPPIGAEGLVVLGPAAAVLPLPAALEGLGSPDGDPGLTLWAYHADLHSSNPEAPALPRALRAGLADGAATASETFRRDGALGLRVAVRMPWTSGPCAIVTLEGPLPPRPDEDRVILWGLGALCATLVGATWLAAGPVVGRVRRLQAGVEASAAAGYATPVVVEGRDEVADLARAFGDAAATVRRRMSEGEEREATLRRFVADTTHDVMVPLTVLQGHLARVRDDARAGRAVDPESVRHGLEEAHYVGALLHNLGAVAKLEADPLERTDVVVDLGRLVERVAERHRPLARGRGIALEHAVPPTPVLAIGDVTLLEQALDNVVHNAVRHGASGGHAAVVLEREGDEFTLRTLDDGPGVPDDDLPRLGERRFRSQEARTRDPKGRGLGLHIARRVAERHGFTLVFRPRRPHGLEVELRGPCAALGPPTDSAPT